MDVPRSPQWGGQDDERSVQSKVCVAWARTGAADLGPPPPKNQPWTNPRYIAAKAREASQPAAHS